MSKTAKIHLYSAWFCPYAQRAWMAINHLEIEYTLVESLQFDKSLAYKKNERLLQINPKGLVPTIEVFESDPLLDENIDINGEKPNVVKESIDVVKFLFEYVKKPVTDAEVADANMVNETICSPFYRCLVRQIKEEQVEGWKSLTSGLESFVNDIKDGHFYKNDCPNIVDFTLYPWAFRLYVLETFRGFKLDSNLPWVEKFHEWMSRMENEVNGVKQTHPDKQDLLKSYERYANATAKSLVGDAVKSGREAHEI